MNARDVKQQQTPRLKAVQSSQLAAVIYLLNVPNIDVNAQDDKGNTALMMACREAKDDVIQALLAHQAILTLYNNEGWSANSYMRIICPPCGTSPPVLPLVGRQMW